MPHDTIPAVVVAAGWLLAAGFFGLYIDARDRLQVRLSADHPAPPTRFVLLDPPTPSAELEPFASTPPGWALRWPHEPVTGPAERLFPDPPPPVFVRQPKNTLLSSVAAAYDQWHARTAPQE